MKQFTLMALLISGLWIHAVNAQSTAPEHPAKLRVTGTLHEGIPLLTLAGVATEF
jgi:hypothetical protein